MSDQIITSPKRLATVSRPTTIEEVKDLDLINRIKAATKAAWVKGHGLAAIQIGVPVRFGWFELDGKEYMLLNPEIVQFGKHWKQSREGCLSVPDQWLPVKRATKIKVRIQSGGAVYKARGLMARIIQHEIDHMDGITILER